MREHHIKGTHWHADGYYKDSNIKDNKYKGTIYEFHGDYWHGNPKVFDQESMHPHRHRKMKTIYKWTMDRETRIVNLGYNLVIMWEHDWKLILKTITQYQRRFRATCSE